MASLWETVKEYFYPPSQDLVLWRFLKTAQITTQARFAQQVIMDNVNDDLLHAQILKQDLPLCNGKCCLCEEDIKDWKIESVGNQAYLALCSSNPEVARVCKANLDFVRTCKTEPDCYK
jgi:hypothetical protein